MNKGKDLAGKFSVYELEVGRIHFFKRQYPQAIDSLLKYEKKNPNSQEVARLIGYGYFFTKQYQNATKFLRLALTRGKEQADAIYYCLALCSYKLNQFKNMRSQLDSCRHTGSNSWFQKSAWILSQALQDFKVDEKRNPWWIQFQLSGAYDSNPQTYGDELPSGVDQKWDWYVYYFLRAEYHFAIDIKTTAFARFYFYGKNYVELEDTDQLAYAAQIGIRHDLSSRVAFELTTEHQHYYVDYHRFTYTWDATLTVELKETEWISTKISYGLEYKWFFYSTIDENDLEGFRHNVGVSQEFFIKSLRWSLNFGYKRVMARPEGDNYKRDEDHFFVEIYGPLVWKNFVGLRFQYALRDYTQANVYSDDGKERYDQYYTFNAYFSREIVKPVTGFVSYTFYRNDSNIKAFDYKRYTIMAGVVVNY